MGSSPLTRGKRKRAREFDEWSGLIPAHAGKTCGGVWPERCVGAHPRSRGENAGLRGPVVAEAGSSPLTRGKPCGSPRPRRCRGLIPAHAGKTPPYCRRYYARGLIPAHAGKTCECGYLRCLTRAHPRSRGENEAAIQAGADTAGSSPLTRGKRRGLRGGSGEGGLIPAHAGKT